MIRRRLPESFLRRVRDRRGLARSDRRNNRSLGPIFLRDASDTRQSHRSVSAVALAVAWREKRSGPKMILEGRGARARERASQRLQSPRESRAEGKRSSSSSSSPSAGMFLFRIRSSRH